MSNCKQLEHNAPMTAFEVLDAISSAYYGKQVHFLQDDGTVYDRMTCRYTTIDDAVEMFSYMVDNARGGD